MKIQGEKVPADTLGYAWGALASEFKFMVLCYELENLGVQQSDRVADAMLSKAKRMKAAYYCREKKLWIKGWKE